MPTVKHAASSSMPLHHGALAMAMALLCLCAPRAAAQTEASDASLVLEQVMQFRITWLGDSTPVYACSAWLAAGRPSDLFGTWGVARHRLFDRPVEECATPDAKGAPVAHTIVRVHSVSIADSVATVVLNVERGHYFHRQEYRVDRIRIGPAGRQRRLWKVRDVVLSGLMHVNRPPPAARVP